MDPSKGPTKGRPKGPMHSCDIPSRDCNNPNKGYSPSKDRSKNKDCCNYNTSNIVKKSLADLYKFGL